MGIKFRQQRIDDGYEVPGGIRDFECPYGAEWGHGKPKGLGEVISRIAKWLRMNECGGCRQRRRALNRGTYLVKFPLRMIARLYRRLR